MAVGRAGDDVGENQTPVRLQLGAAQAKKIAQLVEREVLHEGIRHEEVERAAEGVGLGADGHDEVWKGCFL